MTPEQILWKYHYDQVNEMKQYLVNKINNVLKTLNLVESKWEYLDFNNYGFSFGELISGGLTGGTLSLKERGNSQPHKIKCGSLDVEAGVGLTPMSINFPMNDLPAPGGGIILRIPNMIATDDFSINCFRGMYVSLTQSAGVMATMGLHYMFFGSKLFVSKTINSWIDWTPKLIMTSGVLIISVSSSWSVPTIGETVSVGWAS